MIIFAFATSSPTPCLAKCKNGILYYLPDYLAHDCAWFRTYVFSYFQPFPSFSTKKTVYATGRCHTHSMVLLSTLTACVFLQNAVCNLRHIVMSIACAA